MTTASERSGHCPDCGSALHPAAVLCIHCGYDVRAKKRQTTESGGVIVADSVPTDRRTTFQDFVAPLLLAAIGLAAGIISAQALFGGLGLTSFCVVVAINLIGGTPVTVAGMYLLGAMFNISYGLFRPALLKLMGLTVLEMGAGMAVVWGFVNLGPWMIPAVAILPLVQVALFRALFDLEWGETILSVIGLAVFSGALQAAVIQLARFLT